VSVIQIVVTKFKFVIFQLREILNEMKPSDSTEDSIYSTLRKDKKKKKKLIQQGEDK
jgi:hypothetical protein